MCTPRPERDLHLAVLLALALAACGDGPGVARDLEAPDFGPGPCLDVPPTRLGEAHDRTVRPSLDWDGHGFGVAYVRGEDTAGTIVFERLSPAGEGLGAPTNLSADTPAMSPRVTAVEPGGGFGVVWYAGGGHRDDIHFRRVDADGQAAGDVRNVSDTPAWSYAADVVFREGAFGVTWLDESSGGLQTWFRVLDDDGRPRTAAVRLSNARERAARPALARTPAGFAVVWTQWPDGHDPVLLTRLDAEGRALDPVELASDAGPASHPAVLATPDGLLVAWDDGQDGGRVMLRAVDAAGRPGPEATSVAGEAPGAVSPALARAADGRIALLWSDTRAGGDTGLDLWFRLLDARGRPTTPPLAVSGRAGDDLQVAAAWDGAGFGLTWFNADGADEHVYFAHVRLECGSAAP